MGLGGEQSAEGSGSAAASDAPEVSVSPVAQSALGWAATQQYQPARLAHGSPVGAATDHRPRETLIGKKLGHFRIAALIGQGGMGQVYRAVDERLHRDVALKVLPPDIAADPEWRSRLMREARSAAAVSHRNVASVFDVGEEGDRLFIAMELVEGETLRHRIAAGLTIDDVIGLATQIARGIARAHEKGVLHRDLKPDNVMVGPEGDVKILDFGLAKLMTAKDEALEPRAVDDAGASQAGFVRGTPGYMSPEQILGEELDHRSDLFSFGVMLYEMVTGVQPFRGSVHEIFTSTLSKSPPTPTDLNPTISPGLEGVITRCLARWPAERMPTARKLVSELELVSGHSHRWPTGVVPPSTDVPIHTTRTDLATLVAPSRDLPGGIVTILCAYLAEATQLHQRYGERYLDILARYHDLLGVATRRAGGYVVEFAGEQAIAIFRDATRALETAVFAQRAFHGEVWPEAASVRVRIGLHTAEPKLVGDRYVGIEMHRAMRVGEAAPGGQVVLTAAAQRFLRPEDLGGLSLKDLGPLRIKDLHYPERLFEVSIPSLPEARSVVHRLSGSWNKLPQQATAFIGRTRQIAEVIALLRRGDARLVTLTGPGGTGKTRLSIEVARALLRDFADGVVQVSLGAVRDPTLAPASIAEALDVAEVPGKPLLDVLKNSIGQSRLLLVLDNFEQIVDAAPVLGDLLASCAGLKVLVTSREVLKVSGEHEYNVPPLDVPQGASEASLEAIASCESVQLFVERVRAVQPSFEMTAENAPLVAAICGRLEGIPLAIELAASRVKMLTLPALHKRLSDRLGFLKGTDRDRAQRHQTLRAAIDWSFNLLDEAHKTLLCRVAVFTGGFFIESAEEVCGAGDDLDLDIFEGLSSLVDKSLLTRHTVDGEPRLGALETIREYALERLRASPDEALMRARHAEHFAALAGEMAPGVMGPSFRRCAGRLFTEADNIRAALEWALEQPSQETTARLMRSLLWFWAMHGRIDEGHTWATRALEQTRAQARVPARAAALEVASWLSLLLGDIPSVLAHSTEGVALCGDLRLEAEGAHIKILLGLSTAASGDFPEGVRITQEACDACRARKDTFGTALALNMLGELARAIGDYDQARVFDEEAIELLNQLGNIITSSLLSINLAYCYLHKGDWARAAQAVIPTLERSLEFNNPFNIAFYLAVMACVAIVRERHAEGLQLFGAFGVALRSLGAAVQPGDQAEFDRYSDAAKAALGEDAAAAALQEGAGWTRDRAIAATLALRS